MSDYLPKECLIEILIRVPVKSLLRFRCVSKTWHSLISSPLFINIHFTHQKTSHDQQDEDQVILFRRSAGCEYIGRDEDGMHTYRSINREECFSLHKDDDSFPHNPTWIFQPQHNSWETYFSVVGSMNGIVCLVDRESCYFWNLSLNKAVTVTCESKIDLFRVPLGFAFDPITNDLKLVKLHYSTKPLTPVYVVPPLVDVFTLSTNSWRQVSSPGPMYMVKQSSSSPLAFVSGSFHWVAHTPKGTSSSSYNVIVAFDMANEVFHEIALPNCLATKESLNMTVVMLHGSLSLVPDNDSYSESYYSNSVWIMEEYGVAESWTKLFDIDLGDEDTVGRVITFRKNGELLLSGGLSGTQLLSYQPCTQETSDLNFGKYKRCDYAAPYKYFTGSYFIDTHMESLLFLNAPNEED